MAGILAVKLPHKQGRGYKLMLYVFNDDTHEDLAEKLDKIAQKGLAAPLQEFYEQELKPLDHCLFQTIDIDDECPIIKK